MNTGTLFYVVHIGRERKLVGPILYEAARAIQVEAGPDYIVVSDRYLKGAGRGSTGA